MRVQAFVVGVVLGIAAVAIVVAACGIRECAQRGERFVATPFFGYVCVKAAP